MNKVKILSIISIGLLAANLFLIWFLVSHKPPGGRQQEPKEVIIEKLHLNEPQIAAYEKLIDAHRENIRQSEKQMMLLKNELYLGLQDGKQINSTDSLIAEIGKVQIEIEHINYKHFQEIKQLCKPEQLKSFDELCIEIAKLFASNQMPPHDKK